MKLTYIEANTFDYRPANQAMKKILNGCPLSMSKILELKKQGYEVIEIKKGEKDE